MTDEAGVRLASDPAGKLTVSLAPGPFAGDQVIEESGARLFVDADVAQAVADKALDAGLNPDGNVIFALNDQPS